MTIKVTPDFLEKVDIIVSETALDKPIRWEMLKFVKLKKLAIIKAAETLEGIESQNIANEDKFLTTVSIVAYQALENICLKLENDLLKKGYRT